MRKKTKYIANGLTFHEYKDVEKYAELLGLRITNTETIKLNVVLITLSA